jgi:glutamyl-tRNA synthetase
MVDDAAQGMGEIVRGDDLVDSTPRQILLARLLRLPVPRYAHVPLVFGADGARLAKRGRPPALSERREPPAAALALLAHTLGLALDRGQVREPAELLAEFDPGRLPREPSVLERDSQPRAGGCSAGRRRPGSPGFRGLSGAVAGLTMDSSTAYTGPAWASERCKRRRS